MSDNSRIKTYKNRNRQAPEKYNAYVPQYQVRGVEPAEYRSAVVPENTQVAVPKEAAQRVRKVGVRQPYAESVPSPVGRGKGPIPNVGNNVEHTWSGVDGDLVDIIDNLDEQTLDPNHPMVDNNDFVSDAALGFSAQQEVLPMLDEVKSPPRKRFTQQEVQRAFEAKPQHTVTEDLFPVVADLEDGSYLLLVDGVPVCSGPKEEIEEQARALVFGEHEMCDGNPVPEDDIVIIKRVTVKVGLFLE